MNVGRWIHAVAEHRPEALALRTPCHDATYAELAGQVDQVALALAAAGVGRGDRVAWLGLASVDLLATLFACARVGALFVPLNWRLAPPEHRALLARIEPALLVAAGEFAQACERDAVAPPGTRCVARHAHRSAAGSASAGWREWIDRTDWRAWSEFLAGADDTRTPADAGTGDDTPLLLCFTSGSTGEPKGVLLSARAIAANADAAVQMHGMRAADRVLTTLPLFHVGGLNIQTLPALRSGCRVTLMPRFDPEATLVSIARERITLTVLVPAQIEALLAHPLWAEADLSSLRMLSTGSTLVPRRLIDAVHERGVPLIQVWGATETGPVVCCQQADEALAKAGSAGRAALAATLRVVDAEGRDLPAGRCGEVLVRAPQLMNGYWRDPAATAQALADGWFHSGDSGHLDADGCLWIDGRLKDMIISGGENVSPAEVESILLECPEVAEAAVVGRPDPRWGEAVVAVVAPRAGAQLDAARLLARYTGRLARYKHPRELIVVDALPRTALGKVRKEDIRQLVARTPGPAAVVTAAKALTSAGSPP
ncbi:MAG: AMP-binding protein [Rubrivivax sp.]|nr:AMP-binding protein [Rubrivivax sp.]